jgi:hypothetical protein
MSDRRLKYAGQSAKPRPRHRPIGECVARLVDGFDLAGMLRLGEYRRAWDEVVPAKFRSITNVLGLRGGVLTVAVGGDAERYLLQVNLRPTLLAALNQAVRGRLLRDLRFVMADLPADSPPDDE